MKICNTCGWEIKNWWHGGTICDDCALDVMIAHNKEQELIK